MNITSLKEFLKGKKSLTIQLPDQSFIPFHFHITEIGVIKKTFIDCGGVFRTDGAINFQIWVADDINHRLDPQKLLNIIDLAENEFQLNDEDIEVEYQTDTLGKYSLDHNGTNLLLLPKKANCLAPDKCGVSSKKSCC